MLEEKHLVEQRFYAECARLIGAEHHYKPWVGRPPNRWNNRHAGNGRFPGFGAVRMFSTSSFHVMLHTPRSVSRQLHSEHEVFDLLRSIFGGDTFTIELVGPQPKI